MGSSAINLSGPLGPEHFRNKLLNGDFNFFQRGIKTTVGPSGGVDNDAGAITNRLVSFAETYGADRFYVKANLGRGFSGGISSVPRISVSRQGFSAGYPQVSSVKPSDYFCRITVGASDGSGANSLDGVTGSSMDVGNAQLIFGQGIDTNVMEFSDSTCYLSFLAKSHGNITNPTIGCRLAFDPDQNGSVGDQHVVPETTGATANLGSGFRERIRILGDDIAITPDWTKYTRKFKFPSFEDSTLGTVDTVHAIFMLAHGPSGPEELKSNGKLADLLGLTGLTGAIDIAQVQLEIGNEASTFEKRNTQVELAMCQRYYEKTYDVDVSPGGVVGIYGGGIRGATDPTINPTSHQPTLFEVRKRTSPTVTLYGRDGQKGGVFVTHGQAGDFFNGEFVTASAGGISESGFGHVQCDQDLGNYSNGDTLIVYHFEADAEIG